MKTNRKKPRRVVIGVGHPWYSRSPGSKDYDRIQLTVLPVAPSILLRGGEKTVVLSPKNTGNWNKVRLIMEVLK